MYRTKIVLEVDTLETPTSLSVTDNLSSVRVALSQRGTRLVTHAVRAEIGESVRLARDPRQLELVPDGAR